MTRRRIILPAFLLAAVMTGCGVFRWAAGTSLSRLRAEEKGRFALDLPLDSAAAFALVTSVVGEIRVTQYLSDFEDGYLVTMGYQRIFPSAIDTTEVAFFFTPAAASTRLEIVSLNNALSRFVADNFLFWAWAGEVKNFPGFALDVPLEKLRPALRQVLEEQGETAIVADDGSLSVPGLKLARGRRRIESSLLFFLREESAARSRVAVGSFSREDAELAAEYLRFRLEGKLGLDR